MKRKCRVNELDMLMFAKVTLDTILGPLGNTTWQIVVAEGETENFVSSIIVAARPACSLDIYTLVALCPYIGTPHFPCSLTGSLSPRKCDEEEGFGMHSEFGCMVHQVKITSCPLKIPLFSILLDIFFNISLVLQCSFSITFAGQV